MAQQQAHRYVVYGFTVKNGLDLATKPFRNLAVAQSFARSIGKHYATVWLVDAEARKILWESFKDRDEHRIGTYL
jgi:hypothetical protein